MSQSVFLEAALVIGAFFCVYLYSRREWAWLIVFATFLAVYPTDMYLISRSRVIFISDSLGTHSVQANSLNLASSATAFVTIAATLGASLMLRFTEKAAVRHREVYWGRTNNGPRAVVFVIMTVGLSGILLQRVLAAGVRTVLASRQTVFADSSPLVLFAYYALPALITLGTLLLFSTRDAVFKLVVFLTMILALLATALTGSRTSLLLALVGVVAVLGREATLRKSAPLRLVRNTLAISTIVVSFALVTTFLTTYRGVVGSTRFWSGPDISQADVLISLNQTTVPERSSSVLGSLLWMVPRAAWPGKPLTGNILTSLLLSPGRYRLTGAQTTSGLVGEGFLNFGFIGGCLYSVVVLIALGALCASLLRSINIASFSLGVIFLSRGINLVRGDMADVLAPLSVALVIWILILGIPRRVKTLPARSKAWVDMQERIGPRQRWVDFGA